MTELKPIQFTVEEAKEYIRNKSCILDRLTERQKIKLKRAINTVAAAWAKRS